MFTVKSDGTLKSRLVLDGRRQDPSTYDQVRSPTMRLASFRVLLALAAANPTWQVYADDASQAFIQAERPVDRPLWCAYPQSHAKSGSVMLCKRQIYGTHDAPAAWYNEVHKHLTEDQGLIRSQVDECHWYSADKDLHVVVHVDDFCATGAPEAVAKYLEALKKKFTMTGGLVEDYYGLQVVQKPGHMQLKATKYIERKMQSLKVKSKHWDTPMDADLKLPKLTGECKDKQLHSRYRSLVGSISHAAVTCRPDVAVAFRELASHLQFPNNEHVEAAVRTLQYLDATKLLGLNFKDIKLEQATCALSSQSGDVVTDFFGTCDAAHNVTRDAKGITGWAYHLSGGAVSWYCRAQEIVALSSTEAELVACDSAVRELRYLHKMLETFGMQTTARPTVLGKVNMSTLKICEGTHFNPRTKHVGLRYHHVGFQQREGVVKLKHLSTTEIAADALTKPLRAGPFLKHRAVLLGLKRLRWLSSSHSEKNTRPNSTPFSVVATQQQKKKVRALIFSAVEKKKFLEGARGSLLDWFEREFPEV